MDSKKLLVVLSLWAVTIGCFKKPAQPENVVVVKVNGQSLDAVTFSKQLARRLKRFDSLAAKDPKVITKAKEEIINGFLVSSLLTQLAKENNLSVTPDELNAEFDKIRKGYPDDISFRESLINEGLSLDEWKNSLNDVLLQRKVFSLLGREGGSVDLNQKAKEFYDSHKSTFQKKPRVKLQQLVVAKEDDAQRLLKKIREGGSFEELAKKYSISPDAHEGGHIGYVVKGTVPAFDAAFNMRIGQTSGVIKSSYGFHILRVLDKKEGSVESYEQVKPKILLQLSEQREQRVFNQWLQKAIQSAKVERNDPVIEKIRVFTEGPQ